MSSEQVVNKSWTGKNYYSGLVGCRVLVVPHSCENKAISAPSWAWAWVSLAKRKKRKEKIMSFLVATNVVASRPAERRPTGTPHTRAKDGSLKDIYC